MRGAGRNTMLWGAGDTLPSAPPSAGAPAAPAAAVHSNTTGSSIDGARRVQQTCGKSCARPNGRIAIARDEQVTCSPRSFALPSPPRPQLREGCVVQSHLLPSPTRRDRRFARVVISESMWVIEHGHSLSSGPWGYLI